VNTRACIRTNRTEWEAQVTNRDCFQYLEFVFRQPSLYQQLANTELGNAGDNRRGSCESCEPFVPQRLDPGKQYICIVGPFESFVFVSPYRIAYAP
jgi:hypothetical protein